MSEIGMFEDYTPAPFEKWIFLRDKCEKCKHKLVRIYYIDGRHHTYCPGEEHND